MTQENEEIIQQVWHGIGWSFEVDDELEVLDLARKVLAQKDKEQKERVEWLKGNINENWEAGIEIDNLKGKIISDALLLPIINDAFSLPIEEIRK